MSQPKQFKSELRPIQDVIPYENNSKLHPPEQIARLQEMMKDGQDQDIVVDRDGVIIKGHGRRLAALALGWTHVNVTIRHDLFGEKSKAARLNDNRVAETGQDLNKLKLEVMDLAESDLLVAFDTKEINYSAAPDLGVMDESVFGADMDEVLAGQKAETAAKKEAISEGRVPLAKAFGFKDLAVSAQSAIAKLMAKAEAATGLKEGDALAAFAEGLA